MRRAWVFAGIAGLCAAAVFGACRVQGMNESGEELPKGPVYKPNELVSLSLRYNDTGAELIRYDRKTLAYSASTEEGHDSLKLSFQAAFPEIATVTVLPAELVFVSGPAGAGQTESTQQVTADALPVPVPDRDFYLEDPPSGVADYVISVSVLAAGEAEARTYLISVAAPLPPELDMTVVEEKLQEAEETIANIAIVVGDTSQNTDTASLLSTVISELDVLKTGTTATRQIDTGTEIITETYPVYNYPAIVAKTRQLTLLIEQFEDEGVYVIVPELSFGYKESVQKVTLAHNGVYEIELKGASGGHMWTRDGKTAPGGRGGHVKARFTFTANTALGIRTGGEGPGTASYNGTAYAKIDAGYIAQKNGGWNGGGNGSAATTSGYSAGGAGGGATDVRLWGDSAALTFDASSDPRLVVAAGGGGAAQASSTGHLSITGGNGGEPGKTYRNQYKLADSCAPLPGESENETGQNGIFGGNLYEGRGGGGGGFKGGGTITSAFATVDYKGSGYTGNYLVSSGAGGTNHVRSTAAEEPVIDVASQWGGGTATIRWIP